MSFLCWIISHLKCWQSSLESKQAWAVWFAQDRPCSSSGQWQLKAFIWKAIWVFIQHSNSRYREIIPDIGNSNSRYREINFRYREMVDFPISGNDFQISGIDFPISGNVLDFPISGNQFPISENRHPTEAGHSALPHRPLSMSTAPSYTGPICLRTPSLRLQQIAVYILQNSISATNNHITII